MTLSVVGTAIGTGTVTLPAGIIAGDWVAAVAATVGDGDRTHGIIGPGASGFLDGMGQIIPDASPWVNDHYNEGDRIGVRNSFCTDHLIAVGGESGTTVTYNVTSGLAAPVCALVVYRSSLFGISQLVSLSGYAGGGAFMTSFPGPSVNVSSPGWTILLAGQGSGTLSSNNTDRAVSGGGPSALISDRPYTSGTHPSGTVTTTTGDAAGFSTRAYVLSEIPFPVGGSWILG